MKAASGKRAKDFVMHPQIIDLIEQARLELTSAVALANASDPINNLPALDCIQAVWIVIDRLQNAAKLIEEAKEELLG